MPSGYLRRQAAGKPPFNKLTIGRLPVAFSSAMHSSAQRASGIYLFKAVSSLKAPGGFPARRTGTFTMEGGVISGNTAKYGGGVNIAESAFILKGAGYRAAQTAAASSKHRPRRR
jgi:hypothetical protein